MRILHAFVSQVADDPVQKTAGAVVPTDWNDPHVGLTEPEDQIPAILAAINQAEDAVRDGAGYRPRWHYASGSGNVLNTPFTVCTLTMRAIGPYCRLHANCQLGNASGADRTLIAWLRRGSTDGTALTKYLFNGETANIYPVAIYNDLQIGTSYTFELRAQQSSAVATVSATGVIQLENF